MNRRSSFHSLTMHIFFDVDYTILGRDSTLRPGTHEIFTRLRDDGHHVYVWSGEGERWGVVRNHGLEDLVTASTASRSTTTRSAWPSSACPSSPTS